MTLTGTGVALVTPFKADGTVDFKGLRKLINHVINGGVDYLVLMGTTAESATLTKEEKEEVVNFIVEENNSRLPLVLGIGGNNTRAVVERIKSADLSNFEAILSVSPYYNKPTQEGIYQHFAAISKACQVDVIMYNVPGRTSSNMSNETVIRLANDFDNIIGVKDATGDIFQGMRLIKNKPKDFLVISGDDALALPLILVGGSGVISVLGQGLPNIFSEMVSLAMEKKVEEASDIHYKLLDFVEYIFEEGNPSGIKSMLKTLDICGDTVRLPLISASNSLSSKIELEINRLYSQKGIIGSVAV